MQPSITHVEGVAVPFISPNPPSIVSVIQHDPVTVTETLNAQLVEQQRAFEMSRPAATMTVHELTADIAHQSSAMSPQRGLADAVGWGRNDGNTDHIRKATEEARAATALFNTQNMVRSTDFSPNTGVPLATRSFELTTTNGPVTYRESDLTPISTTTDAVMRRKKLVDGMFKGASLHDNSVNGTIRSMALQNRSAPRFDGTRAMTLGNESVSTGIKYQLSPSKANAGYTASPTRGGIYVPQKAHDNVNIIRSELDKEDRVLHPHVPLPVFTQNTRAETNSFASRAWSPLRR